MTESPSDPFAARLALKVVVLASLAAPVVLAAGLYRAATATHDGDEEAAKPPAGPSVACLENLKRIGLALQAYHDKHGAYPPAHLPGADGQPARSWRTALLPFLEQQALYDKFDATAAWDAPANQPLAAVLPAPFDCPAPDGQTPSRAPGETPFVVVTSDRTAWRGTTSVPREELTDDPASTALVVQLPKGGVPWSAPQDITFDDLGLTLAARRSGEPPRFDLRGGAVLLLDGTVRAIPLETPIGTIRDLLDVADGKTIDWDTIVPPPEGEAKSGETKAGEPKADGEPKKDGEPTGTPDAKTAPETPSEKSPSKEAPPIDVPARTAPSKEAPTKAPQPLDVPPDPK